MNKQLENLYKEFIKYPYMSENDLETFFTELWNDKTRKVRIMSKVDTIKQKDRQKCIILLKDHLQWVIDNDTT